MKNLFEKRAMNQIFELRDLVLKWDKINEQPRKNGKFDNLCHLALY